MQYSFTFLIIAFASLLALSVISFYKPGTAYIFPLIKNTAAGKAYSHDPGRKDTENGNLVWVYLYEEELGREWNRHSPMNYEGSDKKGQDLKYTLIRYMTSAGLTKDSSGFAGMTPTDIANIQNGITNKNFTVWSPWRSRLYEIIWQFDYYRRGGNPSGHSLTQRLEYFRTGMKIFLRHPLFGTGTGDLPLEYRKQYEMDGSVLDQPHRLLSHNQFLSFLVSFGITGIYNYCLVFFLPVHLKNGYKRYLPAIFFYDNCFINALGRYSRDPYGSEFLCLFLLGFYFWNRTL